MKSEYDFSKGESGKFYRPDVELNLPVYLDSDVAHAVRQYADKGKTEIGALVNRLQCFRVFPPDVPRSSPGTTAS
jgi:hypothetical protein